MAQSLSDLEAARSRLLQQFLGLGDFRPGSLSSSARRCGKPNCQCARPGGTGHLQFRLLRKLKGKSVSESFPTLAAFRKAAQEVNEFRRFQLLAVELTSLNEKICGLRSVEPDEGGWTEEERNLLPLFIEKLHAKSIPFSR